MPGRFAVARDTKPVYQARIIYARFAGSRATVKPRLPSLSDAASLDAVLLVREELNNINYARRERERKREREEAPDAGITWLAHWPLRCPPVSNAIINYLAVGATALAPLGLFLILPHPHALFLPLSSLARLGLPAFPALSLSVVLSAPDVSATKPLLFVVPVFRSQLTRRESNPRAKGKKSFFRPLGLSQRGAMIAAPIFTSRSDYLAASTHSLIAVDMTLHVPCVLVSVRC